MFRSVCSLQQHTSIEVVREPDRVAVCRSMHALRLAQLVVGAEVAREGIGKALVRAHARSDTFLCYMTLMKCEKMHWQIPDAYPQPHNFVIAHRMVGDVMCAAIAYNRCRVLFPPFCSSVLELTW